MKVYILFWIFLGVDYCGIKTHASARRCKHIESFHGGDVHYFGERKQWSFAFYRCKDGYHLSPSNLKYSTCTDAFEWDPVPPQCLKSCRLPEDSAKPKVLKTMYNTGDTLKDFECDFGYIISSKDGMTCQDDGSWSNIIKCVKKSCRLPEHSAKPKRPKNVYYIGDTLKDFKCDFGYTLSSKDGMRCQEDGSWSNIVECVKDQCSVPEVKNAVLETNTANKRLVKIKFKCDSGHHFDENNSKEFVVVCRFGNWSRSIPVRCWPDSCKLKMHEGSKYFFNENLIENAEMFPHSSHVGLQCFDNFDIFDDKNNIVHATSRYPHMTCDRGNWKNIYKCKKRCNIFDITNGNIFNKEEDILADKAVVNGDSIIVRCESSQDKDFQMKCDNGEWQGYVDCNDERKKINADNVSENITFADIAGTTETIETTTTHTNGCLLNTDKKFTYRDENNIEISEGSLIGNGTTLTVSCATFDYYDYLYDDDENNKAEQTITCINGELSRFDLDCPVLCDDQCIENGGKCVTGKCLCPEGRHGPNCENKSCRLPEHSAKPKGPKNVYNIGDTLKDFECDFGYTLSSKDGMRCQEDGSWSNIVHCVKSVFYLISVKTANDGWKVRKGSGIDANVYIYLHGQNGKTNKIYLVGDFESNDRKETRVKEKDIRPITSVTIGHDGRGSGLDWPLEFVSIYIERMNEYYVFRLNQHVLITESKDVELPLKDNCVHSFDKGNYWYPDWDKLQQYPNYMYDIGGSNKLSERACLQKCTELTDFQCISVHNVRNHETCWGLTTADEGYFKTNRKSTTSVVYIRTCRQIV